MKRLLTFLALCLPIYLFSQGFGSFSHDQPYLARSLAAAANPCEFQPPSLTNQMMFWFDAGTNVVSTNGSSPPANGNMISHWTDRSTNNIVLTNWARTVYTYSTDSGFNSKPGVKATDSAARIGSLQKTFSQPYTIFFVTRGMPAGTGSGVFSMQVCSTNYATGYSVYFSTPSGTGPDRINIGDTLNSPSTVTRDAPYIVSVIANGASSIVRTNGRFFYTGDGSSKRQDGLLIGHGKWDGSGFTHDHAFKTEIIGYQGIVTSNDCRLVEEYLGCKYSITTP